MTQGTLTRRRYGLIIAFAFGLVGCAEGDSLFSDAGNIHSGRYDRELTASRHQVEQERTRATTLTYEQQDLQTRTRQLNQEIARQKKSVNALKMKVAELDEKIQESQGSTVEAETKKAELKAQINSLSHEVSTLQKQIASNPSAEELRRLKEREQQLSQEYSDLLAIYKAL